MKKYTKHTKEKEITQSCKLLHLCVPPSLLVMASNSNTDHAVFPTHYLICGGLPHCLHWPPLIDFLFLELRFPFSLTQDSAPVSESKMVKPTKKRRIL